MLYDISAYLESFVPSQHFVAQLVTPSYETTQFYMIRPSRLNLPNFSFLMRRLASIATRSPESRNTPTGSDTPINIARLGKTG